MPCARSSAPYWLASASQWLPTGMHMACTCTWQASNVRAVDLCLRAHASCDLVQFTTRDSPLMLACAAGSADCVALLLERRANVGYQRPATEGRPGITALHCCCEAASRLACAKLLLEAAADVNQRLTPPLEDDAEWAYFAKLGDTPIWTATYAGNLEARSNPARASCRRSQSPPSTRAPTWLLGAAA